MHARVFEYLHVSFAFEIFARCVGTNGKRETFYFLHRRILFERYASICEAKKRQLSHPPFLSLSLFLFGQANNREGTTYTQSRGYTARHLRNHVSVPLLRSHASSRASIEERFHGAMLAIRFHRLVSRSFDPPRIYFKSATRERIPHLIIDGQFHTDTDMRMGE